MNPKADDSDSDHVPIQKISPHPKPGISDVFFEESQPPFSDSETKIQNPYDNINFESFTKIDPISTTTHSTLSSTTSQRSNGELYFTYLVFLGEQSIKGWRASPVKDARLCLKTTVCVVLYLTEVSFVDVYKIIIILRDCFVKDLLRIWY